MYINLNKRFAIYLLRKFNNNDYNSAEQFNYYIKWCCSNNKIVVTASAVIIFQK